MLTNSQEEALGLIKSWLSTKYSPVFRLGGPAGSGKSYLIRLIAEHLGVERCLLITPTGKAANNLIKAGLEAHTIHSQIYKVKSSEEDVDLDELVAGSSGNPLSALSSILQAGMNDNKTWSDDDVGFVLRDPSSFDEYRLIIIDEGSMVGERLLGDVMSFGVPVLIVGDPNQLPPVEDKSVFTECDFYLKEIVRQAEGSPVIWLSQQVLSGNISVGTFGTSQIRTNSATQAELEYADIVLTDTNKSRAELNTLMRTNYLKQRPDSHFRMGEPPLFVNGDKIICRTNAGTVSSEGFALTNGAQGSIKKIKHSAMKGKLLDLVMTTAELGDFEFIGTSIPEYFPAKVRPPKIEHGYAITVHLSQGSEWGNVIYRVTQRVRKSALYTAITRAKDSVLIILEE